jgi:hypothetical protein
LRPFKAKTAAAKTISEITPITCGGPKVCEWNKKPVMLSDWVWVKERYKVL